MSVSSLTGSDGELNVMSRGQNQISSGKQLIASGGLLLAKWSLIGWVGSIKVLVLVSTTFISENLEFQIFNVLYWNSMEGSGDCLKII